MLTQRGVPAFHAAESRALALAGMLQAQKCAAERQAAIGKESRPTTFLPDHSTRPRRRQLFGRFGVPHRANLSSRPRRRRNLPRVARRQGRAQDPFERDHAQERRRWRSSQSDPGTIGERLTAMGNEVESQAGSAPERFLVQEMVAAAPK